MDVWKALCRHGMVTEESLKRREVDEMYLDEDHKAADEQVLAMIAEIRRLRKLLEEKK